MRLEIPTYAGYWVIGGRTGLHIVMVKRPTAIHRYFMKLLLGIEWRSN